MLNKNIFPGKENSEIVKKLTPTTELHKAVSNNNIQAVKNLLANNTNFNVQDARGKTALHYACQLGYEEIVKLLLDYEANTQIIDNEGATPLNLAIVNDHLKIRDLVANKFFSQITDNQPTAYYQSNHNVIELNYKIIKYIFPEEIKNSINLLLNDLNLQNKLDASRKIAVWAASERTKILKNNDILPEVDRLIFDSFMNLINDPQLNRRIKQNCLIFLCVFNIPTEYINRIIVASNKATTILPLLINFIAILGDNIENDKIKILHFINNLKEYFSDYKTEIQEEQEYIKIILNTINQIIGIYS